MSVADLLRKARAEAWDHCLDEIEQHELNTIEARQGNPYRAVGDPDPTPDSSPAGCGVTSTEGLWCTWPQGHVGPHIAGNGHEIVALWEEPS